MDNKIVVSIAKDFSVTPGSRYREEGDFSGQQFREEILEPKFEEAINSGKKLVVNLDGGLGYGTSFLEEVFGGLSRKYGKEKVLQNLEIISTEEEYLNNDLKNYIENA